MHPRLRNLLPLALGALLIGGVCLLPRNDRTAQASGGTVSLMVSQTLAGPGLATLSTSASPGEVYGDTYNLIYHGLPNGPGAIQFYPPVVVSISTDSGASYTYKYVLGMHGSDEVYTLPVCGGNALCRVKVTKPGVTVGAATVTATVSGTAAPMLSTFAATAVPSATTAPSATPSPTATVPTLWGVPIRATAVPTATPVNTPTSNRPEYFVATKTMTPTFTKTFTPSNTATLTPTITPTGTRSATATPTITLTPSLTPTSRTPSPTPTSTRPPYFWPTTLGGATPTPTEIY